MPFEFMDSSGRRWLRDGLGRLYPATEENWKKISWLNGVLYETKSRFRLGHQRDDGDGDGSVELRI